MASCELTLLHCFLAVSGKYLITADGELHILNIQMSDSGTTYQCKAINRLTKEVYRSTNAGKLFVTGKAYVLHQHLKIVTFHINLIIVIGFNPFIIKVVLWKDEY